MCYFCLLIQPTTEVRFSDIMGASCNLATASDWQLLRYRLWLFVRQQSTLAGF